MTILALVGALVVGMVLGAVLGYLVLKTGFRALGMGHVIGVLAEWYPEEFVGHCPECRGFEAEDGCTCGELVHFIGEDGAVTTAHQDGCPLVAGRPQQSQQHH